jgi:alkanesulfonate monooxygenase SsuD/methylene tetrahydromethanopterin reductase-like flavin-dependent oxidoreductase (luciferase family)
MSCVRIGEHHREEYLDAAPAVILGAAAARARHIRLTSAVTVLSAADPVRVFQQFATLDLLSEGRADGSIRAWIRHTISSSGRLHERFAALPIGPRRAL